MHSPLQRHLPRVSSPAVVAVIAAAVVALALAPSASARNAPLHITVLNLVVPTSFSCPDPTSPLLCDVGAAGDVRSNLSRTRGSVEYDLVIDFSPAFDAPCNVVDETAVFTFDTGTLTITSHHRDCPATVRPGPRVDTTFTIVDGTGAFAAASSGGTEHSAHAEQAPIVYNGKIH